MIFIDTLVTFNLINIGEDDAWISNPPIQDAIPDTRKITVTIGPNEPIVLYRLFESDDRGASNLEDEDSGNIIVYGELDENGMPSFENFPCCVMSRSGSLDEEMAATSSIVTYTQIAVSASFISSPKSQESFTTGVKIEYDTADDSGVNKDLNGVKEAMTHFVISRGVTKPATTIKKLLKQALDPTGEIFPIQNARTIAEIWEACANTGGFVPDVDPDSGDVLYRGNADDWDSEDGSVTAYLFPLTEPIVFEGTYRVQINNLPSKLNGSLEFENIDMDLQALNASSLGPIAIVSGGSVDFILLTLPDEPQYTEVTSMDVSNVVNNIELVIELTDLPDPVSPAT